ncbi:MAG TPA: adenosylcobinamide amidohydrolase [Thermodesulfobacteriaceae bacterium]|nr:adenosylcobinamide amidohydrolase [Thermodesulfobacteriaceae bacterium]
MIEVIKPYEGLVIKRGERILFGEFLKPHTVISTCRVNGGLRSGLRFVANHQACEPKPHPECGHGPCLASREPERYHRLICEYHGLSPEETALLGTAANMALAGFARKTFRGLTVFCAATAGVESNAGRAGDPASFYEEDGRFIKISDESSLNKAPTCDRGGTIVLMVFVNHALTPGALVRAVKMATEAKVTVLEELHVASRYSCGRATGTGTDQIAVAALECGRRPLSGAGKHVKLGELIALSVREALFQALALQNKLTPDLIRYAPRLLERYGLNEEALLAALKDYLPSPVYEWLVRNVRPVFGDLGLVSHLMAYLHLWDQVCYGVIPSEIAGEVLLDQAALIACALSQRRGDFGQYLKELAQHKADPKKLLLAALALGFTAKWHHPLGQAVGVIPG